MKKKIIPILIAGVVPALTLSSCSIFKSNKGTESSATVVSSQTGNNGVEDLKKNNNDQIVSTLPIKKEIMRIDSISVMQLNGMWTLRTINNVTLRADKGDLEENRPYINFDSRTGKFYANDGCNTINGEFIATQSKKLKIDQTLTTMMMCPDAKYEQQFKLGLAATASFKTEQKNDENLLYLYDEKGHVIMELVRPMTDFLNGSWTVSSIDGKSIDNPNVKIVIDIPEEKVHGNSGCNIFNGKIFVDPDKDGSIQFQEIAMTRMLCPDMETETALMVALESVHFGSKHGDEAQLMDSQHRVVITLKPLNLK